MSYNLPSNGPRSILFRLPRELRDIIYRLVLVAPHPLRIFVDWWSEFPKVRLYRPFDPELPPQWLALLSTNHEIRAEAAATLYGAHQFVLVDKTDRARQPPLLERFLGIIGPVNAGHLRHIYIRFHDVNKKGGDGFWKVDLRGLDILQDMCGWLTTLETRVDDGNSRILIVPRGPGGRSMSLDDVKRALAEVEERVKGIAAKRVVVKLYHSPLQPEVEELMRSFGWVVRNVE